ncbi:hypothetical protein EJB05_13723, partial [Eragrostis curvula]
MVAKKVCVVGAGISGLASAHELCHEGHHVTVMEQSPGVGGQWLYDPVPDGGDPLDTAGVQSSIYSSLRLNFPRQVASFTDFPFYPREGGDARRYPAHGEYFQYIRDFCDAFGLMDAVRLNTRVVRVAMAPRDGDGDLRWLIVCLCEDGTVVFADGSCVIADAVVYCTGYNYSFPFLDTGGVVTVDDNLVGPLFEHTFPPALAPSLSFVGVPKRVNVPRFYEVQARWVAQVLSARRTLPPVEEMLRSVEERDRAREMAGVPKRFAHSIFDLEYCDEFGEKYWGFPRLPEWRKVFLWACVFNMRDNYESFRDDYHDSDLVREGLRSQGWLPGAIAGDDQEGAPMTQPEATCDDVKQVRKQIEYPAHGEYLRYIRDFCDAFGLMDAVRLNTRVERVAMAPSDGGLQWVVKWTQQRGEAGSEVTTEEEVFDAVVVAVGMYTQPSLPTMNGMDKWRRRQLHSHSYRVPDSFRDEVVVVVGCHESGKDISLEIRKVAREVHISVKCLDDVIPGVLKAVSRHQNLHLHPKVDCLCEDGTVVFTDGSCVVADAVVYCTGYHYSYPFLDTGGVVTVDDNRVGPLYEHTFSPALAPSLSFVGVPKGVNVPRFYEMQARWVAQVLSGKRTLPPVEEMLRSVAESDRAREMAGVPKRFAHHVVDSEYCDEFGEKYCGFPRLPEWKKELLLASVGKMRDNVESFRDEFDDSDLVRDREGWSPRATVGDDHEGTPTRGHL